MDSGPAAAGSVLSLSTRDGNPYRWLKQLDAEDRKVIGEDNKDVEFSWPIRCARQGARPRCGKCAATCGRVVLLAYVLREKRYGVLHGFIKKTSKTPKAELDLALRRKKGRRMKKGHISSSSIAGSARRASMRRSQRPPSSASSRGRWKRL
jgi:hypothetical protein